MIYHGATLMAPRRDSITTLSRDVIVMERLEKLEKLLHKLIAAIYTEDENRQ